MRSNLSISNGLGSSKTGINKSVLITPLRIGKSLSLLRKEPCQSDAPLRIRP